MRRPQSLVSVTLRLLRLMAPIHRFGVTILVVVTITVMTVYFRTLSVFRQLKIQQNYYYHVPCFWHLCVAVYRMFICNWTRRICKPNQATQLYTEWTMYLTIVFCIVSFQESWSFSYFFKCRDTHSHHGTCTQLLQQTCDTNLGYILWNTKRSLWRIKDPELDAKHSHWFHTHRNDLYSSDLVIT